MIERVNFTKTENYILLKNQVLSNNFPWYYHSSTIKDKEDFPFFGHSVVKSPGNPNLFSTISSSYSDLCNNILFEIFSENNIEVNCVIRVNLNMTIPVVCNSISSHPHYDHKFDHKNLLVYLNDSDGDTVVYDENKNEYRYSPKEDSALIFCGKHYQFLPTYNRRVVLVSTFI